MWKPETPIVADGRALTDQAAWWHEFEDELRKQHNDEDDSDWLVENCRALFRHSANEDPRRMARLAYAILVHDPEGIEDGEHAPDAADVTVTPPHRSA